MGRFPVVAKKGALNMAIKREKENKFDVAVAELNEQEAVAEEKAEKVIRNMTGSGRTKTIVDKNGRTRNVKVSEKRKTMPVYIPESLYEQFDAITTAYGKSNNSAIVELIRDYVTEKRSVLKDN